MAKPKIIVINNDAPIREAIDFVWETPRFKNHLEYWDAYLQKKKFQTVSHTDVYSQTRNLIGLHICLEGNIVFMDTSPVYNNIKTGIIFLPSDCRSGREKLIYLFTSDYQQLSIFYGIKRQGESIFSKEKEIIRPCPMDSKVKCIKRPC